MTPERTSPRGQYRTDWRRKEIGRIRVTYGKTLKAHGRAVALLDDLYDNDQWDVLRAIKAKRVTIRALLAAKKVGRTRRDDVLVDLRLQQPLWSTLEGLVSTRGGKKHQSARRSVLKKFARVAGAVLGTKAKVADLKKLHWNELRPSYASAAYWNHLRRTIGALLSELLESTAHPFRVDVMKKIAIEDEPDREVDITVDQFWALVAALPEYARPCVVTLAATAMRVETEYLRCAQDDKRPLIHAVYCPGSKNADATGNIPVAEALWEWVDAGIPSPIKLRALRRNFHNAAVAAGLGKRLETDAGERYTGITLHDLRHMALQLALDGGAALNDVQSFARHADPAMTMKYLKRAGQRRAADALGRMLVPAKEEKA